MASCAYWWLKLWEGARSRRYIIPRAAALPSASEKKFADHFRKLRMRQLRLPHPHNVHHVFLLFHHTSLAAEKEKV